MHNKGKKLEQLINEYFDYFRQRVEPPRSQIDLKLKHPLIEEFPEQLRLFLYTYSEMQTNILNYAWHIYELHELANYKTEFHMATDYATELFVRLTEIKQHILTKYSERHRPIMRRLIYPDFEELTDPNIPTSVKKAHWDKQNNKLALFEKAMKSLDPKYMVDDEKAVPLNNDSQDKLIKLAIEEAATQTNNPDKARIFIGIYAEIHLHNSKIKNGKAIEKIQPEEHEINFSDRTYESWIYKYKMALKRLKEVLK